MVVFPGAELVTMIVEALYVVSMVDMSVEAGRTCSILVTLHMGLGPEHTEVIVLTSRTVNGGIVSVTAGKAVSTAVVSLQGEC